MFRRPAGGSPPWQPRRFCTARRETGDGADASASHLRSFAFGRREALLMRAVLRASVRFRLIVAAGAVAVLFVGGSQLRKMPVEVLPDFTPTTVEVQTEALGLSAPEVEQLITV